MCSGEEQVGLLLASLEKRGVNPAKLTKLPAYQKLLKKSRSIKKGVTDTNNINKCDGKDSEKDEYYVVVFMGKGLVKTRGFLLGLFICVLSVIIGYVYQNEINTHQGFTKFWLKWENIDLNAEQCTIDMPPVMQDLFRPPVQCDMCTNITYVERVRDLSPALFEQRYAYSGRPVVVTDGQRNWTAKDIFSFSFFKSIYSEDSPVLENFERDCQFFPYQTEFSNLRQVFNMSQDRANMLGDPWYIGWSNCDSSAANILRGHYERPYFLPQSAESSKTDWIFMGTPGYGAHLHIDHVGNPSWQGQIKGRKLWTLEPPPECHYHCVPMEILVEPGEIIVLDTNIWYHKTLIVSSDLSITIGSEYD